MTTGPAVSSLNPDDECAPSYQALILFLPLINASTNEENLRKNYAKVQAEFGF